MKAPKALWVVAALVLFEGSFSAGNYLYQQQFEGTRVQSLVFSPDSETVYGSGTENSPKNQHGWVWAWNAATGRLRWKSRVAEPVYSALLSPKGDALLTTPAEGNPRVWDTATGKLRCSLKLDPERGTMDHSYFTPDGKRVMGCYENGIQVWNTTTGQPYPFWKLPEGESGWPQTLQFSADGTKMLVGIVSWRTSKEESFDDACVQLWDSRTGQLLERYSGSSHVSALSPSGTQLAVSKYSHDYELGVSTYQVVLITTEGGLLLKESPTFKPNFALESLEYLPEGNLLCKGSYTSGANYGEPQAFLWNTRTNILKPQTAPTVSYLREVISPDKKRKAITHWGGYQHRPPLGTIYDTRTGEKLRNLEGLAGR